MKRMLVADDLRDVAIAIKSDLVADRRAIHRQPELGYQERKTSALVAERLRGFGLEVRTGVGETGVVGLLRGSAPGKTVLLRADMDALPIQEENATDYVSQTPGVMHACGHDGHTAMLLGVARLLSERRDQIRGTVKFMFQPAEEGGAGAKKMIEDGVLSDPPVDAAFALHVYPERRVGQIGLCPGLSHAASDSFQIVVNGRGGHAARPQGAIDPIVVSAQIVTALQTLVSREVSPTEAAVVTVGSLVSGQAHNVIPDSATIRGTVRAFKEDVRALLQRRIGEMAVGIASAMRASAEVEYRVGYPTQVNDIAMVEVIRAAAGDVIGADAVLARAPAMGGEDFAFVLQRVPGAMFFLGVRDPAWETPRALHTATFDLAEDALPVGVAIMATTALRFLDTP
jgi:amidohydrolase